MNQHDQMLRNALLEIQTSAEDCASGNYPWPHKQNYSDIAEHAKQALAAEPAPLVMVTDLEMLDMYCEPNSDKEMFEFGRAVQKRFMEKNGLKHEPN